MINNTTTPWLFPHTPAAPEWALDWEALAARFGWIRALRNTPQDPIYHAEGDVFIHTRMVAEALIAMDAWRALPAQERTNLFAAALLHDVAKPKCTVIEPDGRITSKKHARRGEEMARDLLWRGSDLETPAPFPIREQIAKLVRHHGQPLWFFEKPSPERAVIEASQTARLDLVALLAEADVRGRICNDQQELLERVQLFREFCQEQQCFTSPRQFANPWSRFVYFHDHKPDPTYNAYDTTTCEVVMMSGLPGAGKDTWIRNNLPDWPVVSLDQIRRELKISPAENQGQVVATARERARELLRRQQSFIWNATTITRLLRSQLIDFFVAYHARVRIVYLDAPYDVLMERDASREHRVPEHVILDMARRLEIPDVTEAPLVEWVYSAE
jgi:predicted kinase